MILSRTRRSAQFENRDAASPWASGAFSRIAIVGLLLAIFAILTVNVSQACEGTDDPSSPVTQGPSPYLPTNWAESSSVTQIATTRASCCGHCHGSSCGSCCPACSAGILVGSWMPLRDDGLRADNPPTQTHLNLTAVKFR